MIDSGSTYCLISRDVVPAGSTFQKVDIKIAGWNGVPHVVKESVDLLLSIDSFSTTYVQNFLIAPTSYPILGANFLHNNNINIESSQLGLLVNGRLIRGEPLSSYKCCMSVLDYQQCPIQSPCHSINLTAVPKSQRFRPLSGDKLLQVRK